MNCKQGDLAVVVRARDQNFLGRFVTCLEFMPTAFTVGMDGKEQQTRNAWIVDVPAPAWAKKYTNATHVVFPDTALRPLRDTDGDDETLTWAGKPSTIDQPTKENA